MLISPDLLGKLCELRNVETSGTRQPHSSSPLSVHLPK